MRPVEFDSRQYKATSTLTESDHQALWDKTDFSEVKKFVIDLFADHFPDIENDCGAESEAELDEHLRSKLIGDCQRFIREGERIQMRLKAKHTQPAEDGAA